MFNVTVIAMASNLIALASNLIAIYSDGLPTTTRSRTPFVASLSTRSRPVFAFCGSAARGQSVDTPGWLRWCTDVTADARDPDRPLKDLVEEGTCTGRAGLFV